MQATAQYSSGQQKQVNLDKHPDRCPICHHWIQALDTGPHWAVENDRLEIVFRCPRPQCERFFIGRYKVRSDVSPQTASFVFSESVPLTIETSKSDEIIQKISADFVSVYREAEEAELRNLKLICGPGYRKALEFLIKDYVIRLNPGKDEEIKRMNLGKCISDFVRNDKVREVAARAVWLGNDEVHYLRKWEEKDLQDLKNLITLTVLWIRMEELTEAAIKEMPAGR